MPETRAHVNPGPRGKSLSYMDEYPTVPEPQRHGLRHFLSGFLWGRIPLGPPFDLLISKRPFVDISAKTNPSNMNWQNSDNQRRELSHVQTLFTIYSEKVPGTRYLEKAIVLSSFLRFPSVPPP